MMKIKKKNIIKKGQKIDLSTLELRFKISYLVVMPGNRTFESKQNKIMKLNYRTTKC